MNNDKSKFKVGDIVKAFGFRGKIVNIKEDPTDMLPIEVDFNMGINRFFTLEGKGFNSDACHIDLELIERPSNNNENFTEFKAGDEVEASGISGVVTCDDVGFENNPFPITVLLIDKYFNCEYMDFTRDGRLSENGKVILKLIKRPKDNSKWQLILREGRK